MAIQFARIEIVSRSTGGNACCKGSYNARMKIKDTQSNITYNFQHKGDNVYHEILLPSYVDAKFKDPAILMNEVERTERRKDSQLLKDVVIALPDDKELNLQDRIEITKRIIARRGWVKEGLGVQLDIHEPHDGERNWHVHLLVTTRRFTKDGKGFGAKARDLNPEFKNTGQKTFIIPEEVILHEDAKEVINEYFKELGLESRVDPISTVPEKHIGPIRMRSLINQAVEQNELRKIENLENIKDEDGILNRITRTQSIFTQRDVERAVKEIEDIGVKRDLVKQVMHSERLVKLYSDIDEKLVKRQGFKQATPYYTTREVREEELRTLRVATKINDQASYSNARELKSDIQNLTNVSEVQREAIKAILLKNQGVRVLRGRAGTGKSHVLGVSYKLATKREQNVIGLAPTHKAVSELQNKGYGECYTVKGFLFKLYNGKIDLPMGSLLVVDEAGMVGTSDYLEFMKVARSNNCNVVLAGDERQLTSVNRGGMFEVFANKFGSYELSEIRRQSQAWGREMALCFAEHNITKGIALLEKHQGLKVDDRLAESMSRLINDWSKSKFALQERLIITVRNKDVDALNRGIRELLKANGLLTGQEYRHSVVSEIMGKKIYEDYMAGERILFKTSNKKLFIENGEFATLRSVNRDQFVAITDNGTEVTFDPKDISFKHGYASTVYKAQGASIKDVYVLHNLAGNSRNSYVEMTRHVEEVKMYTNREYIKNRSDLIAQLSRIDDKDASLNFLTGEDLARLREESQKTVLEKVGRWFKSIANDIGDRLHHNSAYYKVDAKIASIAEVEEVLERTALHVASGLEPRITTLQEQELQNEKIDKNILLANDNDKINDNYSNKPNQYQEAESSKIALGGQGQQENKNHYNKSTDYERKYMSNLNRQQEMTDLKQRVAFRAELIAHSLLSKPNGYFSDKHTLRWGENGKMAMKISGKKAGIWYDFSAGKGGDLFALVQQEKNCDFVQAKEYLKAMVGMSTYQPLASVKDMQADKFYQKAKQQNQNDKSLDTAKIKRAQDLYEKVTSGKFALASSPVIKYLSQHRGLQEICAEHKLCNDIGIHSMWDSTSKQYYPALIAFVRNDNGAITGGQTIYLDQVTGAKANIKVNKRSFGKISGSFVEIQKGEDPQQPQTNNITIIAEGVETALSLQEAGLKGKILCSLGVSNIRNYKPQENECILIAADNDGPEAASLKTINNAKTTLESYGATVVIAMPQNKGDFNDVLKTQGSDTIRGQLMPVLEQLSQELEKLTNLENTINHDIQTLSGYTVHTATDREAKQYINYTIAALEQSANSHIALNFKQNIQDLERFATPKDIITALEYYKNSGFNAMQEFTHKACTSIIESKINHDLQIMQEKWSKCWITPIKQMHQIVVTDFQNKPHTNNYDYLVAIGQDTAVMRYITKGTPLAQQIQHEVQRVTEHSQDFSREK